MIKKKIKNLIHLVDQRFVKSHLKVKEENNSLISFLFHGIFKNQAELDKNLLDPQQGLTVDHYRQIFDYYIECGYRFITPKEILAGLDSDKKYILLTFDDGYYNTVRILPLLREFGISASFFISTHHVLENRSFWWDTLYRLGLKKGRSPQAIYQEGRKLKNKTHPEIESHLISEFGKSAFTPVSDIDRPFTPKELKDISRERNIFIGNHTLNHGILTNYNTSGIRHQINQAQEDLKEMIGFRPDSIAYPNGGYSDEVVRITRELGLKIGVTCNFGKNKLPIMTNYDSLLKLSRFCFSGSHHIKEECDRFRTDFSPFLTTSKLANMVKQSVKTLINARA